MTKNVVLFFKHKTAYGMLISDWSSDVGSSDLVHSIALALKPAARGVGFNPSAASSGIMPSSHVPCTTDTRSRMPMIWGSAIASWADKFQSSTQIRDRKSVV